MDGLCFARPGPWRWLAVYGLLAAVLCSAAWAAEPGIRVRYLADPRAEFSAQDVLSPPWAPLWRATGEQVPNFGLTRSVFWFLLEVEPSARGEMLLEVNNSLLRDLRWYRVEEGAPLQMDSTGSQPLPYRNPLFKLPVSDAGHRLLLRVQGPTPMQLPLRLWEPAEFARYSQMATLVHGGYFGLLLALTLAALLLFLLTRDFCYLYGGWLLGSVSVVMAMLLGFLDPPWWSSASAWVSHGLPAGVLSASGAGALLAASSLGLGRWGRPALVLRTGAVASLLALAVTWLPDPAWGQRVAALIALNLAALILALALLALRRRPAIRVAAAAWTALAVGVLVTGACKLGLLPWSGPVEHAFQLGSAVFAVLLGAATLARGAQRLRQRFQDQVRRLAVERARRCEVERSCRADRAEYERVASLLDERCRQLAAARRQLAQLAADPTRDRDALTGLRSRHFFDQRYRAEWRRAFRDRDSMGLILVEVREPGRPPDDIQPTAEQLQAVAAVLTQQLQRPSDTVARFDDALFAVLMPATTREGVAHVAEILARRLRGQGRLDIFVGAAATVPDERHHEAVLLSYAGEALFEARSAGDGSARAYGPHRSGREPSLG